MSAAARMPVSTRLWTLAVLGAATFCGWALLWPAPAQQAGEAGGGTLPVYPQVAAPAFAAPNPADAAWARPLFFNDRNPRVAAVGDESGISGDNANGFMATLTGIVRSPGLELATLTPGQGGKPLRVRLGDEVETQPGWRLVSLGPRTATFRNGEQEQVLKLEARNAANAPSPPPLAPPPASNEPRAPAEPPPPATPGITGQAGAAAPTPPNPATAEAETPEQRQQVEAIRQRIQARRRQMSQPAPPSPVPRKPH